MKKLVGKGEADLGWAQMTSPKQSSFFDSKMNILVCVAIGIIVVGLILPPLLSNAPVLPIFTRLLALAAAIFIPCLLGRKRLILITVWLAIYLTAYGILSWHGAYIGANHGGT